MTYVRLAALAVLVSAAVAAAQPPAPALAVAAASDLQSVMPALAARFERETSRRVTLTFGSSGNFFSQIQNGAPFDLFFSADVDYPRRLEAAGLTEPGTLQPYAIGRLVLYASTASNLDLARPRARPRRPDRRARAAHRHREPGTCAVRPRGRCRADARATLQSGPRQARARRERLAGRAVRAVGQCRRPGCSRCRWRWRRPFATSGTYVDVPASFYPTIEQAAVVIKASSRKDAARQFLAFLGRPEIAQMLNDAGFLPPRPAAAAR